MGAVIDLEALHKRVPITDGHADSLMWNRDLTRASNKGHVDFPRLQQAGVKIQCFTIVTRGFPPVDTFAAFAWQRGWPKEARASLWRRCTAQLDAMARFCAAAPTVAAIANTGKELTANLKANRISAVLGVEGAHAIEGDLSRVETLYQRGVRFMSLTHLGNNELGGTSTPFFGNRPLTTKGEEVLEAMNDVGMAVDLAHASEAMLERLVEHPSARIFCSHTGVRGAYDLWRNLPDWVLRKIAERGGVAGIIFAPQYLGGRRFEHVALHIEHALDVMGEDSVALGSDFDGMVPLPQGMRDVRDLAMLTQTLLDRGMTERVVEKVLGHNFRRFLGEALG